MSQRAFITIVILLVLVAGCSMLGSGKPAAVSNIASTPITPGTKGKVTPSQFVELGMNSSGIVAEVLVSEGEQVNANQVLVRLEDVRLKLAVEEARLKLQQAELDLENAQKPAEPAELAAAEKAVQAAQVVLTNVSGARSTTIEQAQSTLRSAELAVENAERERKKLLDYKNWGFDVTDLLRNSQVKLDNLHTDLEIARRNSAGAGTRASQSILEAEQALAAAQAKYDKLKRQPEPEDVKTAQLVVESAKVALARAEANLKNTMLVAPIAGMVAEVKVKAGQQVAPGTPVFTLADTSAWFVETDDLSELTVVDVKVGSKVVVKLDAVPGLTLPGHIEQVALRSQEKHGAVTYTVRVLLDQADPRLRWGMTSFILFAK